MPRPIWLLLLVSLALPVSTIAGSGHDPMLWMRYNQKLTGSGHWYVLSEWELRMHANPFRGHQLLIPRLSVATHWHPHWHGAAGVSLFLTYQPIDSHEPIVNTLPEYRGHQDVLWKRQWNKWTVDQRWRLEQRFLQTSTGNLPVQAIQFQWRFRWMAQVQRQVWAKGDRSFRLFAFHETLTQAGKPVRNQFVDQLRFGAGGHISLSSHLEMDLHYFYWHQFTTQPGHLIQRDILRLTLYHHLSL